MHFFILKDIYESIRPIWYIGGLFLFLGLIGLLSWSLWKNKRKDEQSPTASTFLKLYTDKIKGYKKVVFLEKDRLLLLSEYGYYLFYFYPEEGIITGNYMDDFVTRKPDNIPLRNPFLVLRNEMQNIVMCKEIPCTKILIIKESCHFGITDYQEEILLREKSIIAKIENHMGQTPKYKKEEIDELYKLFSVNLCQSKTNNLQ